MKKNKTLSIQKNICREEVLKGNLPCENISPGMFEMDVLSILKSGNIVEIKVKSSRSDFKADAKKIDKWNFFSNRVETQIPNYFYYACPSGMIKKNEIQDYAGLIYVEKEACTVIKRAKILHRYKHDILKILIKMCRMKSERKYLGSCLMTYKNKLAEKRNKATNIKF